jgi:hypothetical protein
MSLDDIREILSWHPISELDQFRLSVKMQVMRIVFAIGTKALLDGRLGREAALLTTRAILSIGRVKFNVSQEHCRYLLNCTAMIQGKRSIWT